MYDLLYAVLDALAARPATTRLINLFIRDRIPRLLLTLTAKLIPRRTQITRRVNNCYNYQNRNYSSRN